MTQKTIEKDTAGKASLTFSDNKLLPLLFGEQDSHLTKIEEKTGVSTSSRGSMVSISGAAADVEIARAVLQGLYDKLEKGMDVTISDVEAAIRMESMSKKSGGGGKSKNGLHNKPYSSDVVIKTQRKHIFPYSASQAEYMKALFSHELTFALGPAGTGKTYLAVAAAVAMFNEKKIDRIILSRPAVEAGEKLGFLPGDLREKVDPYLRPLYDALYDMLPAERVVKGTETGEIEIAPLAFMRGRTLTHSFVILDEAQNATATQMKMFLTRLGQGSRMAVCGDLSQTDLPKNIKSGLRDAVEKLQHIEEVGVIKFKREDIVRHELTTKIVEAYEKHDRERINRQENEEI